MAIEEGTAEVDRAHEGLIRGVLKERFGRDVLEIKPLAGGRNGWVYQLSVGRGASLRSPTAQPATSALPAGELQLVMRVSNPDAMLNEEVRVQNEVAAMMLAREALASLPGLLVPAVYDWEGTIPASNDGQRSSPGWALLEFMPGSRLEDEFHALDDSEQRDILRQIALIFRAIQAYKLPDSVKGFGGLHFDDHGNVVVGATAIYGGGPCPTHAELYVEMLQTQLGFADKCDVVKGWNDSELRVRIEKFASEGVKPLLYQVQSELRLRPTLVHGDFDIPNLLFDKESKRITALLDYDFASVASQGDEYFYSFSSLGGLVPPPSITCKDAEDMKVLRQSLLQGFAADAASKTSEWVNWKLAVMFNEELAKAGAERPQDIAGIGQLSAVYWFIQDISPPFFFLKKWRVRKTPEQVESIRKRTQGQLEAYLANWGF